MTTNIERNDCNTPTAFHEKKGNESQPEKLSLEAQVDNLYQEYCKYAQSTPFSSAKKVQIENYFKKIRHLKKLIAFKKQILSSNERSNSSSPQPPTRNGAKSTSSTASTGRNTPFDFPKNFRDDRLFQRCEALFFPLPSN